MDHFRQAFREEADELLAELEISLLELEQSPADKELIGRVFRAMHTLKGSSAMFGFDDIAAFTHEVETVLDLVRAGRMPVSRELIGLTLQARDQIKALLAVSDGVASVDAIRLAALVAAFRELVTAAGATAPLPAEPLQSVEEPAVAVTFAIRFRPDREIFKRGLNPAQLLAELRELGDCRITVQTADIPPLAALDPELCYLQWDVLLTTSQGVDAIHDVFMFIGEESSVAIEVVQELEPVAASLATAGGSLTEAAQDLAWQETTSGRDEHSPQSISSLRVTSEKLDLLVNLVGEMVTAQARLTQTAMAHNDPGLIALAEEIERLTTGLRDTALNIRMLPIGSTFSRLRRLVHDLSFELGKEVELVTEGAETELDKTVIERLTDPLVHLLRNSVDHGIETPQQRLAQGKAPQGRIRLAASHSGDSVLLTLSDDGAGIDRETLHAKGVAKGLIAAGAELPDRELLGLIFAPGFSTAAQITSISGRGVGMDVVKKGVDGLRGTIAISSNQGEGTTVTIRIPLTLAIIESLLVRIGSDCFVLPLSLVEECIELTRLDVARAHGRQLVNVRGAIIPYIPLRERFGISGAQPAVEQVVIAEVAGKRVGFVVDHVIGEHQTVIKSIGKLFREVQGVSGATILGDGTVALILDVQQLVNEEENAERCRFGAGAMTKEKGIIECMTEQ